MNISYFIYMCIRYVYVTLYHSEFVRESGGIFESFDRRVESFDRLASLTLLRRVSNLLPPYNGTSTPLADQDFIAMLVFRFDFANAAKSAKFCQN